MVSSHQPSLQIREGDVDHREVDIGFLAIAIEHHGLVRVPQLCQIVVAAPSVGAHHGALDYALLHEPCERFGPAVWHETQAQPSCVNGSVGLFAINAERPRANFDGTSNHRFMMDATSFALGAPPHQRFIHLDWPICANPVSVGANHASAELVEHLECGLVASQPKLALKLHRRHAGRLRRHQICAQKPRLQGRPCRMHDGASGQRHITVAMSASNYPWSRDYALRLAAHAARWARKSVRPPDCLKIGRTRHFAGKHLLKLKQRLGLANFHDDHTLPIALGCVNRISKLLSNTLADLASRLLDRVTDFERAVQRRVEAGEAPPFKLVKVNVELLQAQKLVSQAEGKVRAGQATLNQLTAGNLGKNFAIQGDFESVKGQLKEQNLIETAFHNHPEIHKFQQLIEKASARHNQEQHARVPNITIKGAYQRDAGREGFVGGLSIPLPLWNQRQGEIAKALGIRRQAEANLRQAQISLKKGIIEHLQFSRTASAQIHTFEQGLLKQAKEAVRIARTSFKFGEASLLDVLDAQRVLWHTFQGYAQARFELSVALTELGRLVGKEL